MLTIINGFTKTGIWPSNRHMFNDAVMQTMCPRNSVTLPLTLFRRLQGADRAVSALYEPEPPRRTWTLWDGLSGKDLPASECGAQVTRNRSRARRIPVVLTSTPERKLERSTATARDRNRSALNKVSLDVNSNEDHGQKKLERVGPEQDPRFEDFSPLTSMLVISFSSPCEGGVGAP